MINMDNLCKFFSTGEACPYGSQCENSHDIFRNPENRIISKQLDSVLGGMLFMNEKISSLENKIEYLQGICQQLKYNQKNITEEVSNVREALVSIGVPVLTGTTWFMKSSSTQYDGDIKNQDLTMRAGAMLSSITENPNDDDPNNIHTKDISQSIDIHTDKGKELELNELQYPINTDKKVTADIYSDVPDLTSEIQTLDVEDSVN